VQRCLDGDIPPSRHYIIEKSIELHAATRRLSHLAQDIEHWIEGCDALTTIGHGTDTFQVHCPLPAGHPGDHSQYPAVPEYDQAVEVARNLASDAERLASHLALNAPDVDRHAVDGVNDPDDRHKLRDAGMHARRFGYQSVDLLKAIDRVAHTYPFDLDAPAPPMGRPSPEVGLGL
jgi:hypothetical protein